MTIRNLAHSTVHVRHYRIDAEHSNSHTRWKSLGSPQDPTPEELAHIKAGQGLEELEPARTIETDSGRVVLDISLPLPAASLLILKPAR